MKKIVCLILQLTLYRCRIMQTIVNGEVRDFSFFCSDEAEPENGNTWQSNFK